MNLQIMEEDFSNLLPLVKHYIVKGLSPEQVFQECVKARGHSKEYFSIDLVSQWFREVEHNNSDFCDASIYQFCGLIQVIKIEFAKAERGIEERICSGAKYQKCGLKILSGRWGIDVNVNSFELDLIDVFQWRKRSFKSVEETILFAELGSCSCAIEVIDPNTILFIQICNINATFDVHLFKFDCDTMEPYLVSSQRHLNGVYDSCHIDRKNPHKFIIFLQQHAGLIYQKDGSYCSELYEGSIEDGLLVILDKTFVFYPHPMQQCFKLEDDNICRLVLIPYDEIDGKVSYNKIKIGAPPSMDNEVCFVDFEKDMDQFLLSHCFYVWHKDTCYILNNDPYSDNLFVKIDVETRIMTNITWFRDLVNSSRISDMHFDENEVLCICTGNQLSKQHTVHRLAVCQPDTLLNLSLQVVYGTTMFLDKNNYREALKRLPQI